MIFVLQKLGYEKGTILNFYEIDPGLVFHTMDPRTQDRFCRPTRSLISRSLPIFSKASPARKVIELELEARPARRWQLQNRLRVLPHRKVEPGFLDPALFSWPENLMASNIGKSGVCLEICHRSKLAMVEIDTSPGIMIRYLSHNICPQSKYQGEYTDKSNINYAYLWGFTKLIPFGLASCSGNCNKFFRVQTIDIPSWEGFNPPFAEVAEFTEWKTGTLAN